MAGVGVPSTRAVGLPGISKGGSGGAVSSLNNVKGVSAGPIQSNVARTATPMHVGAQPVQAQQASPALGLSQLQALMGGGESSAPSVNYAPSTFSVTAQNNPQLEALQGQAAQLQQGLAADSDQDATLALQRQRDLNSGAAKEFGADAASRGIFGSGAAAQDLDNRLVSRGQDQLGQLNASLAGDARNKQLQVLGAQSGLAGQQAQLTQADKQFALNTYEAQEGAKRAQAQLQLSAKQSQAQQGMQLASLLSQMYTGF